MRVFLVSCSRICFTSRREGWKSGSGARPTLKTLTSIRCASRASRLRRTVARPRVRARNQARNTSQSGGRASGPPRALLRSAEVPERRRRGARANCPAARERSPPSPQRPVRARVPSRSAAGAAGDVCTSAPTADRQTNSRRKSSRDEAATSESTADGSGDECPRMCDDPQPLTATVNDQPPALPHWKPPPLVVHAQGGPYQAERT